MVRGYRLLKAKLYVIDSLRRSCEVLTIEMQPNAGAMHSDQSIDLYSIQHKRCTAIFEVVFGFVFLSNNILTCVPFASRLAFGEHCLNCAR